MIQNQSRSRLCHIMENITEFEFRTPDALGLKQELRRWYYGGQDGAEADKLLKRFDSLFSGNVILDAVSGPLWTLAEESPLPVSGPLYEALSTVSRRQIVGRSIRAYEAADAEMDYQFGKWEDVAYKRIETAAYKRIETALNRIDEQLRRERAWRVENRMSLPSALVSLAGIAALAFGIWFLLPIAWELVQRRSFANMTALIPSWGSMEKIVCLLVFVFVVGTLLFLLPRMVMTLCAGLFWTVYHKGRFKLRSKRVWQFRAAMRAEVLGGYCEELRSAAQKLADLPPDAPERMDPSRALLGWAGISRHFRKFSVKWISKGWRAREFYQKVEQRHVCSRRWIIVLCAALVLLEEFLRNGPIMVFLQRLIS